MRKKSAPVHRQPYNSILVNANMSDLVVNVHSVVTKLVKRMERIIGIAVKCRAGIRPDPHIALIVRTQCGYEICIKSQLFTII